MEFGPPLIEPTLPSERLEEKPLGGAVLRGSAKDYLNIFIELAMRLEQLPQMPEVADHVMGWKSVSYSDFRRQTKQARGGAGVDAHDGLSPYSRERFETCVAELDTIALASVASVRRYLRDGAPTSFERVTPVCHRAVHKMRPILSRASRLVKQAETDAA